MFKKQQQEKIKSVAIKAADDVEKVLLFIIKKVQCAR